MDLAATAGLDWVAAPAPSLSQGSRAVLGEERGQGAVALLGIERSASTVPVASVADGGYKTPVHKRR